MVTCYETPHGKMNCFENDVAFVHSLKQRKVFEEDMVLGTLVPMINAVEGKKVILDIGAHIGSHSLLYSKYIPDCEIHAFEPQTELYTLLVRNMDVNSLSNVKTYNMCVGHASRMCSMSKMLRDGYDCEIDYATTKSLNYGGMQLGLGGELTTMITVDSLHLQNCTYMKMDVEGAEPLVIMGALETIRKYKPIIFFEQTDKCVNDEMKASLSIDFDVPSSVPLLEKEGYTITNVDDNNKIAMPIRSQS